MCYQDTNHFDSASPVGSFTAIQRKEFFDVVFNRQLTSFKAVAFGNYLLPKI
jgi:hypothetical protein